MRDATVRFLQVNQPWTVPYAECCQSTIDKSKHAVLHAMKSVGKLAAMFEEYDHKGVLDDDKSLLLVADMAADLMTVRLRLANLLEFDLCTHLMIRSEEKNGVKYQPVCPYPC